MKLEAKVNFNRFEEALQVVDAHVLGGHQDDGADGIAPVKGFRCRQGGQGQGCGQDQAGQGQGQLFPQISGVQTDHGNSPSKGNRKYINNHKTTIVLYQNNHIQP